MSLYFMIFKKKHKIKINLSDHPKYIQEKIKDLDETQFGYNAFGLEDRLHKSFLSKFIRN